RRQQGLVGPRRRRRAPGRDRRAWRHRLRPRGRVSPRKDAGARIAARLAARTSHDLNNILAIFSGHLYLLRESAEPLEEGLDAMEKAIATLHRLSRSLADLGA